MPRGQRSALAGLALALLFSGLAHARGIEISGQVLDPQGKPIPGAHAEIAPQVDLFTYGRLALQGLAYPDPVAEAASDASGRFTLSAPEAGMWSVVVEARGFVPRAFLLTPLVEPAELPEVRLEPDAGLKVRVMDREGRPLLKARVLALPGKLKSESEAPSWGPARRLALTGEDGTVTLPRAAGESLGVRAAAAGHLGSSLEKVGATAEMRLAPGTESELPALPRPAPLSGRVLEAGTRKPLAGALVWFEDSPEAFVRTDAQGGYAVPSPAGRGGLQAAATGHLEAWEWIHSPPDGPTILLEPTAWVRGVVVDAEGKPVAGAELRAKAVDERKWSQVSPERSDPQGLFRLRLEPGRRYEVAISHKEFALFREKLTAPKRGSERAGWRVVLDRGRTVFGRVLDTQEQPVAGAEVWLSPESPSSIYPRWLDRSEPSTAQATSDGHGRFRFGHMPAGRFDLTARARGFAEAVLPGFEVTEGETDLGAVLLEAGTTLEGRVVDLRQRPIENAEVKVSLSMGLVDSFHSSVATGADGRFNITDLPFGRSVSLSISKEGYKQPSRSPRFEIPAEPVTIVLEPAFRLSGRLIDESGSPVEGIVASLWGDQTRTDSEGRFTFNGIDEGTLPLTALAVGYCAAPKKVEVPPNRHVEGVEIVLRRGATISGRVLGPDGLPAAGASVKLAECSVPQDEQEEIAFYEGPKTDGDGRYLFDGIPKGSSCSVVATHPEYQRAEGKLEVGAGENRLDLRMERGVGISGRVLDGAGRPVEAATVVLLESGSVESEAVTAADGSFQFPSLPPGEYKLQADREGYAESPSAEVQLAETPVTGVDLTLVRGGAIHGKLLGLEKKHFADVHLTAHSLSGVGSKAGVVDHRGEYRIRDLAPGDWRVTARVHSGWDARSPATVVREGTDTLLNLESKSGTLTLAGRVLRAGQPFPDARINVVEPQEAVSGAARTGVDGAFRIESLEPGSYKLTLTQARMRDNGDITDIFRHEEIVQLDNDRDITIDLPTLRLAGRVVDAADNSPLPEVRVQVKPTEKEREHFERHAEPTDSTGTFTVEGLAEGPLLVKARKPGYAPAETTVEATENGAPEIVLALIATEGLEVEIVPPGGRPPAFVSTALLDLASGRIVLQEDHTSEEKGDLHLRISSAPPGRWRLVITSPESATTAVEVTVPGPMVRVVLLPPAKLTVTVPDLAADRQSAQLTLQGADGQPFFMAWGMMELPVFAGKAEVDSLPSGTWKIQVTAADGRTWQGVATTTAGATVQVSLE